MKLKWGKEKVKGLAKKVPIAERRGWFWKLTDYLPTLVIVTCIVATIWIWVKIYQLWKIQTWLESF